MNPHVPKDIYKFLKVKNYWGLYEFPEAILDYIKNNLEETLMYLYKKKDNEKIINTLKELLIILEPKNERELFHLYKICYYLEINNEYIFNCLLLNKNSLYIYYSNKFDISDDVLLLTSFMDAVLGSFFTSLGSEDPDANNILYLKTIYPIYSDIKNEDTWEVQLKFPELIKKMENYKNIKFYYKLSNDEGFYKLSKDLETHTIFEWFIITCIEGSRYISEFFYGIEGSTSSILKLFSEMNFIYDVSILFKNIFEAKYLEDEMYSMISKSYIINYLLSINDKEILKYIKKIKWDKIVPYNYETNNFYIKEEDLSTYYLKYLKFLVKKR